eukprot:386244_1
MHSRRMHSDSLCCDQGHFSRDIARYLQCIRWHFCPSVCNRSPRHIIRTLQEVTAIEDAVRSRGTSLRPQCSGHNDQIDGVANKVVHIIGDDDPRYICLCICGDCVGRSYSVFVPNGERIYWIYLPLLLHAGPPKCV